MKQKTLDSLLDMLWDLKWPYTTNSDVVCPNDVTGWESLEAYLVAKDEYVQAALDRRDERIREKTVEVEELRTQLAEANDKLKAIRDAVDGVQPNKGNALARALVAKHGGPEGNNLISAIRNYRADTGCGLLEARNAIYDAAGKSYGTY